MDAVYRLSFAILGNEADARDAAQETFVAAWRQIGRVRDADRFDAWLQRVAINAARMQHRGRRRRAVREIAEADLGGHMPERGAGVSDRSDAAVLDIALSSLPIEQRAILVLHHLEGLSVAEIAAILAIPAGTVKSRLHTARHALQREIEQEMAP